MTKQHVTNLNQALSVLIQASDQGRKAGIYDWSDLDLISQSIQLIKELNEEQSKKQSEQLEQTEQS